VITSNIFGRLKNLPTPFYYYNKALLEKTLEKVSNLANQYSYHVHYAMKANTESEILNAIQSFGLGADCVSGNEVKAAIKHGFPKEKIVYAGVGKSDWEMDYALDEDIFCFNVESIQELQVLNERAQLKNRIAQVALRINPNVASNTHRYITTGLDENKFGINLPDLNEILDLLSSLSNIKMIGLHFHIGSQITDMQPFKSLCLKVNQIIEGLKQRNISIKIINVGGGLGIDYHHPNKNSIADFEAFFQTFHQFLEVGKHQEVHFELGRSIVAQCGYLISKTLFIKKGSNTQFLILDAGMSELIRPALYQAYHQIDNLSAAFERDSNNILNYDVVGPICESSDCFGKSVELPESFRNDLFAIRSAGAYGQVMASNYNLREKPEAYYF
jgi:diaminopimelate decarboxylase